MEIYFKFGGTDLASYGYNTPVGWLSIRGNAVHNDGTPLLSPDCTSIAQIEYHAVMLKRQIDEAVKMAKRKLPH